MKTLNRFHYKSPHHKIVHNIDKSGWLWPWSLCSKYWPKIDSTVSRRITKMFTISTSRDNHEIYIVLNFNRKTLNRLNRVRCLSRHKTAHKLGQSWGQEIVTQTFSFVFRCKLEISWPAVIVCLNRMMLIVLIFQFFMNPNITGILSSSSSMVQRLHGFTDTGSAQGNTFFNCFFELNIIYDLSMLWTTPPFPPQSFFAIFTFHSR